MSASEFEDDDLIERLKRFSTDSPYEERLTTCAAERLAELLAERAALPTPPNP